jgi:hypothetical protein
LEVGAPAVREQRSIGISRYLDVVLVAVAAPLALALGAPTLGCLIGALAWIAQRVLAQADRRWIGKSREPRMQLGLNLAEAFGRIWLLAGAIIIAGVAGGRADGLTAGLVIFGAYSIAFAIRVISGPPERPRRGAVRSEAPRGASAPRGEGPRGEALHAEALHAEALRGEALR